MKILTILQYLLSQGDDVGAVEVIQHIAKKNKVECPLSIEKLHEVTKSYESHDLPLKKFSNKDNLLRNIKQLNLSHIKVEQILLSGKDI